MNMSKFKNGDIVINISIIWIFVVIIFTILCGIGIYA